MKRLYYKLVRDNIPDILDKQMLHYQFINVHPEDALEELVKKLGEEADEVAHESKFGSKDKLLTEVVDVMTVCRYIARYLGCAEEDLEDRYNERFDERGGYDNLLRLIYVVEPDPPVKDGDGNE